MGLKSLSSWMGRGMQVLFLALCLFALWVGIGQSGQHLKAFLWAVVGVAAAIWVLRPFCRWSSKVGVVPAWIALTLLCLVVKGLWVALVQVPVSGDYAVFWGYANSLAQQDTIQSGRYVALFPHIFGYASFLSWFIRLFGAMPLLAQAINVLLSVCSGSLLFVLGWKWWGLPAGISAYLFWIACPSQTMYNSLILSEPLYTTLILAFFVLLTLLTQRAGTMGRPTVWGILWGVAAGGMLRWINGIRPIAAILLIAAFLWLLLLRCEHLKERNTRWWVLPFLLVMTVVYVLTGPLWSGRIAQRIGEEPSSTPGYSILVGFNHASSGQWNRQDSETLYRYSDIPGVTAQQAQQAAMEKAVERITSGKINFLQLFREKIRVFLGSDNSCVAYSTAVLRHTDLLSKLCNGFYYGLLLLSLGGCIWMWRSGRGTAMLLAPLYVLGLTGAQMLVEVAGRYHYSLLPMLVLTAQAVLWGNERENRKRTVFQNNSPEVKTERRNRTMADTLYIVVPCYNEEEVLPETSRRLKEKLEHLMAAGKISEESRVLFVNDGSKDRTWEVISQLHQECSLFSGADLSRNRGHQNALLAGLMTAKERCDMAISMDADLQDDIDAVDAMVEQYYAGCDIVYGVRSSRKKDTFFKRFTAEGFYRVMNAMGAETVFNHADYRLMSRRALEGLAEFKEVNLFLRGIVPMIGYPTATVEYERGERFAGESKYPLKKMLAFAMEGITSLSVKPIRMITLLGFLVFAISVAMLIYSVVRWAMGDTILGWASLICSVWAIGGLILLSLGVIGEYIGKIYLETKERPRFLLREVLEDRDGKTD